MVWRRWHETQRAGLRSQGKQASMVCIQIHKLLLCWDIEVFATVERDSQLVCKLNQGDTCPARDLGRSEWAYTRVPVFYDFDHPSLQHEA